MKTNNAKEQVVLDVKKHLVQYRQEVTDMKNRGISIVGYVRKSPGSDKSDDTRTRLTKDDRPSVRTLPSDQVYVSPICKSNASFSTSDMPRPTELLHLRRSMDRVKVTLCSTKRELYISN